MSILLMMQKVRERPGLYLRKKSLELLAHFKVGYELGISVMSWEKETGLDSSEHFNVAINSMPHDQFYDSDFFVDFFTFVCSHYSCKPGAMSEDMIISTNSASDEEAFDKYFELFDMFLKEQKIKKKIE